jgi:flagellar hook-length control protein FliK
MGLAAVLPTPPSGARTGGTALGAPAAPQDGPSFADVLSAADGSAPSAAPASAPASAPAPAPRADVRHSGADAGRSGSSAATGADGADSARDPADERADPAADAASPDSRRAAADGPAHTHVAAHGRGQALAHARARAAVQAFERARTELAGRGDAAAGETSAPLDGLAGPARGRPAAGPLAPVDDAAAAKDAALHAAAAAADPALAPLIAAAGARDGTPDDGREPADAASAAEAALVPAGERQDTKATHGLRAPIGGDTTARTARGDADAALEARGQTAGTQHGRAPATEATTTTETASAAAAATAAVAAAARAGDPPSGNPAGAASAALAAAALAAGSATLKDTKTAGADGPASLPSGAPAAAAPAAGAAGAGAGVRHAGARAVAGQPPSGAASAGAADAAVAAAQSFASAQADALRALGERLRSGANSGSESGQAPTAPVFQPPLPAGVAAPRADAPQESAAQGGSYPITVPVQDPRFADAFSERVTWLVREGLQGAELTLNPQELGPIRIELALDGDAASIGVIAANPETRGAIEQALPRLREMLSAQGLQLGGTMIDAGSGRASQGDGGRDGGRGRAARTEARDGIASLLGGGGLDPGAAVPARTARAGRIDVFA